MVADDQANALRPLLQCIPGMPNGDIEDLSRLPIVSCDRDESNEMVAMERVPGPDPDNEGMIEVSVELQIPPEDRYYSELQSPSGDCVSRFPASAEWEGRV